MEERMSEGWSVTDDLLALLIEVSSVTASGRQLKKPLEVPRPKKSQPAPPKAPAGTSERDVAFKRGINLLASTSKGVRG
jgi:hypothetical protein